MRSKKNISSHTNCDDDRDETGEKGEKYLQGLNQHTQKLMVNHQPHGSVFVAKYLHCNFVHCVHDSAVHSKPEKNNDEKKKKKKKKQKGEKRKRDSRELFSLSHGVFGSFKLGVVVAYAGLSKSCKCNGA
jgi:hypothetical protein